MHLRAALRQRIADVSLGRRESGGHFTGGGGGDQERELRAAASSPCGGSRELTRGAVWGSMDGFTWK